jgi:hypothetical protein
MIYDPDNGMKRVLHFTLLHFFITCEDLILTADMLGAVRIDDDVISLVYEGFSPSVRDIRAYNGTVGAGNLYEVTCYDPGLGDDVAVKLVTVLQSLSQLKLKNISFKRYSSALHVLLLSESVCGEQLPY